MENECAYPKEFEDGIQARSRIGKWFRGYDEERPHSCLYGLTLNEAYSGRAFG